MHRLKIPTARYLLLYFRQKCCVPLTYGGMPFGKAIGYEGKIPISFLTNLRIFYRKKANALTPKGRNYVSYKNKKNKSLWLHLVRFLYLCTQTIMNIRV